MSQMLLKMILFLRKNFMARRLNNIQLEEEKILKITKESLFNRMKKKERRKQMGA